MLQNHADNRIADIGPVFFWAAVLNTAYVLVEALLGFSVGSLALQADAAHNLTDVLGLLIAWGATAIGRRSPTDRHTYGLGRATILAALVNGIALLIGVGAIVPEAIARIAVAATGSATAMRAMASRTIAPTPISKAIPFTRAARIVARPSPYVWRSVGLRRPIAVAPHAINRPSTSVKLWAASA